MPKSKSLKELSHAYASKYTIPNSIEYQQKRKHFEDGWEARNEEYLEMELLLTKTELELSQLKLEATKNAVEMMVAEAMNRG